MALHPGEQGCCSLHGTYDEFCGPCADTQRILRMLSKTETYGGCKVEPEDNIPCTAQQEMERKQCMEEKANKACQEMAGNTMERRAGCVDLRAATQELGPRNRRSEMRVTDIHRIVDKRMGPVPTVNSELKNLLAKEQLQEVAAPGYDKNSPSALKQLRWAIYEAVDNCHARTSSTELNKEIERLFQEYTNS